jgi:hypothetical protein
MLNQAFFKRVLPFIITLAAGLLVASFFVSLAPTFKFKKNRCGKRSEMRMLKYEKERLELENKRLKQRLEESERMILIDEVVPPPPPAVR